MIGGAWSWRTCSEARSCDLSQPVATNTTTNEILKMIFQMCEGGGRCYKCRCDFSSMITLPARGSRLEGLLFEASTPVLSNFTPPPPPPLITLLKQDKLQTPQILRPLQSSLNWSCPASLVRSSPIVPYLETLWSTDLTASLFTDLFDMHVCFYRFPSMLLCVGHTTPHVTEETEHSLC